MAGLAGPSGGRYADDGVEAMATMSDSEGLEPEVTMRWWVVRI